MRAAVQPTDEVELIEYLSLDAVDREERGGGQGGADEAPELAERALQQFVMYKVLMVVAPCVTRSQL
jgi:hypothetical protein